jgi:hypothetical protein
MNVFLVDRTIALPIAAFGHKMKKRSQVSQFRKRAQVTFAYVVTTLCLYLFDGGPGRSPTCDLRVRSAILGLQDDAISCERMQRNSLYLIRLMPFR